MTSLLVAGILAVGVLLGVLVADVARIATMRAQLTNAADAAALAAAPATFADFGAGANPRRAAAEITAANGAELVACHCAVDHSWAPRDVLVTVAGTVDLTLLGTHRLEATAAAEFAPVRLAAGP